MRTIAQNIAALLVSTFAFAVFAAYAENAPRQKPKDLETVDTVASPTSPVGGGKKTVEQPTVTTRKSGTDTISEYRIRGRLYQQKVQPENGPAYFLLDAKGEGKFTRVDGPEPKVAVPTWVLLEW